MFSKVEASLIRQEFWTCFGKYMAPVRGADGEKVNWINYKTGEKDIYFRMHADASGALISIELTHTDEGLQHLYFEQFLALKKELHHNMGEEWEWNLHNVDGNGKTASRIFTTLPIANIFKKEDWPLIISFFKQRMVALDAFWSEARYYFESLR